LIRECESRLGFIQDKLRIEVSDQEIETRIAALKSSVLKEEPAKVVRLRKGRADDAAAKAS